MTDNSTPAAEAKPFLGPFIDDKLRDRLLESAKKAPFFIRIGVETLHADEAKLRTILLDLGPDGLEAANLAVDFMTCHDKLRGVAEAMKSATGRVLLTLEQMEADGDIKTTDAIIEPLKDVYDALEKSAA